MHPAFPHIEGKHSESRHNIFGVLFDTFITPSHFGNLLFHVICSFAWMHISDFHAVGNEHTCDGNHPHVPCMHAGKEYGKASTLGSVSLSPVSVGTVMSGMA